jgi:hypothetical protein
MPAKDLGEHENYCGSRTERCEECEEYVMLKYRNLHVDSNHGFIKLDDGEPFFKNLNITKSGII